MNTYRAYLLRGNRIISGEFIQAASAQGAAALARTVWSARTTLGEGWSIQVWQGTQRLYTAESWEQRGNAGVAAAVSFNLTAPSAQRPTCS